MRFLHLIIAILSIQTCLAWMEFLADLKFIGSSYSDCKSLRIYSSVSNVLGTKYFDPSKPSVLIIHGWKDSFQSETAETLIKAFLTKSNYNIIFGDWKSSAGRNDYTAVVGNMAQVYSLPVMFKLCVMTQKSLNNTVVSDSIFHKYFKFFFRLQVFFVLF